MFLRLCWEAVAVVVKLLDVHHSEDVVNCCSLIVFHKTVGYIVKN